MPSSFCSVCSGLALSDEGGNSEGRLENVGLGRPLLLLNFAENSEDRDVSDLC